MELMVFTDPVRPSTVNFESNGATSGLDSGASGSGSSPTITPTRSTTGKYLHVYFDEIF